MGMSSKRRKLSKCTQWRNQNNTVDAQISSVQGDLEFQKSNIISEISSGRSVNIPVTYSDAYQKPSAEELQNLNDGEDNEREEYKKWHPKVSNERKRERKRPFIQPICALKEIEIVEAYSLSSFSQPKKENDVNSAEYVHEIEDSSESLLNDINRMDAISVSENQSNFHKSIWHELNIIKANQKVLMESVDAIFKLLADKKMPFDKEPEICELPKEMLKLFPIANFADLNYIEECSCDESTANQLVLMLSHIGGKTCEHGVKLMLRRLISDELAVHFSFLGVRSKMPFKALNLYEIIRNTVRRNTLWKNSSDVIIEKTVMNWLRLAKSRIDGRKKKNCIQNV